MTSASSFFVLLLASSALASAQGNLTPPAGAPTAGMRTLTQIEPRTPISESPAVPVAGPHFTISAKGSYYLTGNITVASGNAINITASGVTLDLNGFTISSTSGTPAGIAVSVAANDVKICNGHINNGFLEGVNAGAFHNITASDLSIQNCFERGIYLAGESTAIRSCTVRTISSTSFGNSIGLLATIVTDSAATDCANLGLQGDTVSNCVGQAKGMRAAVTGRTITNSDGETLGNGDGIAGLTNSTISNSRGYSTGGAGVRGAVVSFCLGSSDAGSGILAEVVNNSFASSRQGVAMTTNIASYCRIVRTNAGVGLIATTAVACTTNGAAVTVTATNKSLGTP